MVKRSSGLQFTFDENLKKDANLPATEVLSFDSLGDFIEERERIQRFVDSRTEAELRVDYSDFANHVFFDSAESKSAIAVERMLNKYPFDGNSEERDAFFLTGSGYEKYVFDQWPRDVSYAVFDGTSQFISASDVATKLWPGSSSLYVSAWVDPVISDQNMILQYVSASSGPFIHGYEFYLSGAVDPHLKFSLYSGSELVSVSASFVPFTSSFNNVAAIYDKPADTLSLYVNDVVYDSAGVGFGPINTSITNLVIGSGSQFAAVSSSFDFYSGSIDEIRICLTASDLYHRKNYNRSITAEDYVTLHYKFNEGSTNIDSVDAVVIDYSRSGLHGAVQNYASAVRVSGAVMQEDPGDPILYSFNSRIVDFTGSMYASASLYNASNNNQIFNLIACGVMDKDGETHGLLRSFSLAMARYFDEIKLHIDQFVNLRVTNYDGVDETPDLFLTNLNRYFGWKVSEHFGDANPLEFLFGENVLSSGSLDVPLYEIRNQFWRRILNSLPLLLKSKGTRANLNYLFNVLGLNTENFSLKEYGYLPGTSIQDERISKQRVSHRLGIGTGSIGSTSASFIEASSDPFSQGSVPLGDDFTVEVYTQLPFASASYDSTLLSGALWQTNNEIDADTDATGSVRCYWARDSLISSTGKIILESSSSLDSLVQLESSNLEIFTGDFINVAAGVDPDRKPFINVRLLDVDSFSVSDDVVGPDAIFATSDVAFDQTSFYVGAHTSSVLFSDTFGTQGFFGEARYWDRRLSGSEVDDHAYNYQSIGVADPFTDYNYLRLHWALDEDLTALSTGRMSGITDLSRQNRPGTGVQFDALSNPYAKSLHNFNYLSPAIDLKWTENKIRIRNKTELTFDEVATDTNEMSLEFNFVDSLNEDIVKIFSTLDIMNNFIGQPIFKYRDEYSDLEGVRSRYFQRLGDSLNFSAFFDLFKWFDRKISDAIKQLLPARVNFIGGEQVIESHLLERSKYKYHYPVFRTPQTPPEAVIQALPDIASGSALVKSLPGSAIGTYAYSKLDFGSVLGTKDRPSIVVPEGDVAKRMVSSFSAGEEALDRLGDGPVGFFRSKITGDTPEDINDPSTGVNYRYEQAKAALLDQELSPVTSIFNTLEATGSNNYNVLRGLNTPTYETRYYGWTDPLANNFSSKGHYVTIRSMIQDISGTIYMTAMKRDSREQDPALAIDEAYWATYIYHPKSEDLTLIDDSRIILTGSSVINGFGMAVDNNSGDVYVCGNSGNLSPVRYDGIIRKSNISASISWTTLPAATFTGSADYPSKGMYTGICVDSTGSIFVSGRDGDTFLIKSSSDGGDTWGTYSRPPAPFPSLLQSWGDGITIDADDNIYALGLQRASSSYDSGAELNIIVLRSADAGDTWVDVYCYENQEDFVSISGYDISTDLLGGVYVAAVEVSSSTSPSVNKLFWSTHGSSDGSSGSFSRIDSFDAGGTNAAAFGVDVDSNNSVYVTGITMDSFVSNAPMGMVTRVSHDRGSVWETVDKIGDSSIPGKYPFPWGVYVDNSDNIHTYGFLSLGGLAPPVAGEIYSYHRHGRLTANSASIGPKTLSPSVNLVRTDAAGSEFSYHELKNLTEFPHYGGLFQMKNLILGTTDSGKTGRGDDAIVQVTHFGSVVYIMWPRMENQDVPVKGFGELSPGQRPGKLTSDFDAGDVIDVTEHDHMSLYCYIRKEVSGTLDNVELCVERRPTKGTGFAIEQAVEYGVSGSVNTAILRDLVYKKEVDYGDLLMREIAYPIDIPLTNVKEVRISAKHTTGQSEEVNKNFVVWGRFVSEDET